MLKPMTPVEISVALHAARCVRTRWEEAFEAGVLAAEKHHGVGMDIGENARKAIDGYANFVVGVEHGLADDCQLATAEKSMVSAIALDLLVAAGKSGDPGAIGLAAQLGGVPACLDCGYVVQRCRCAKGAA